MANDTAPKEAASPPIDVGADDCAVAVNDGVAGTNDDDGGDDSDGGDDNQEKEGGGSNAVEANAADKNNNNSIADNNRFWDNTSKKVVVHNILKHVRPKEVPKLVSSWLDGVPDDLNIRVVKTKKPPHKNFLQVTLEDESMVEPFIKLINEGVGGDGGREGGRATNRRGKPLFAVRATAKGERRGDGGGGRGGDKRKGWDGRDGNDGGDDRKKRARKGEDGGSVERLPKTADEVRDAITPSWRLSYDDQLESKFCDLAKRCAAKLCKELKNKFRILERESRKNKHREAVATYSWLKVKRAVAVRPILPSPRKVEYRNKVEYTFGYHREVVPPASGEGAIAVAASSSATSATDAAVVLVAGENSAKVQSESTASDDAAQSNAATATMPTTTVRKTPAVGFLAGGWSGGVYPPNGLSNVPPWAVRIADVLNDFVRSSPLPPYDSRVHRGVWRTATCRASIRCGEVMVVITHAPASGGVGARDLNGQDDCTSQFESERDRLVSMLTDVDVGEVEYGGAKEEEEDKAEAAKEEGGAEVKMSATRKMEEEPRRTRVTSIFFQEFDGLSNPKPDHPVQHVYGKTSLGERLGKCTFQISPGAFFQVNTEAAEVLYNVVVEKVREVTPKPNETLLWDLCCGTGTIAITCLKEGAVGSVIGVDVSQPAIADAEINATNNGYGDGDAARFIAARAESVLGKEMRGQTGPCIAVVDPARDGLHGEVVRTIRINEKIQRLVYVSCNPTGTLVRDGAMLCAPPTKKYPGLPFKITFAQPVDLFPLTSHCEMVMVFDRMTKHECEGQ